MRYKFIRIFNQNEKETMTEDERIHMAKSQAVRELTKDLMKNASVETTSDGVRIAIDI